MSLVKNITIIDEEEIANILKQAENPSKNEAVKVLEKACRGKGLGLKEAAVLINCEYPDIIDEIFKVAGEVKRSIYGERLVLFAPLYVSNFCINDCDYCGFHKRNPAKRKRLKKEEIEK